MATPHPPEAARPAARGAMDRFLAVVERGGNALPHPGTLFLLFALGVLLLSDLAARAGLSALHPKTGELIVPVSLLTRDGLHRILEKCVTNFTGFAPLGTVLVAMLGIGIAESSGLIGVAMRKLVLSAPRKLLTVVVVFAGVLSNMASEIGYVLLIPLAALIFQAAGRHPIAGMAAAFAGVSGGYSANLLLGTVDPLLSGLTQEAARIVLPDARVNPACNYYFMFGSTFLLTLIGTLVTERVVEPRLGRFEDRGAGSGASGGAMQGAVEALRPLDPRERRGLWAAGGVVAVLAALVLWGTLPADGFLRDPKTGDLLHSPFMSGIVTLIFVAGALAGLAYGLAARTIKNDGEVMAGMAKSMQSLGGYLVLVFFAAQFVAFFSWSNLGLILAVKGAEALKASGLGGTPVLVAFIFLTGAVNLFMGSASAKWALMAPVFVPMFLLLGYPPEVTQCAYRIGDSCTNVISPMMTYFALIIAFFQRYQPSAGIGTLVATMLPYSVSFLISWSILFAIWMVAGWPLGPG
ncbi:MAG: AbgT family transporter [Planctomycetes bacterium]|nr:AbgT family transporter [Planctomycetota bacterium]